MRRCDVISGAVMSGDDKSTAAEAGTGAATRAAAPPAGSVYCACHAKGSRGPAARRLCVLAKGSREPAAPTRPAAPPGGSVYCACHAKGSRGPAAPTRAAAPPGGSVYCTCKGSRGEVKLRFHGSGLCV